jgi:Ca2+/Na+ antiporter
MQIFRAVVALVTALVAATGITLDTLQITQINFRWWTLVAFVLACVFVIWIIVDLNNKIRELENKKPSISVTPEPLEDSWYLEVTNNGERGIFTAQICVFGNKEAPIDSKYSPIGTRYNALWGNTNTDKSEIMNGQTDIVKIASIRYADNETYFVMEGYDPVKKSSYDVRHIEYEGFRDLLKQQIIQIIISADPSLKDGAFIRDYTVSLKGITESSPKKRMSIPDRCLFGGEEYEETKYPEAVATTKELKALKIYDDSKPGDLIRVFYYLKDKLAVGLSENETSNQDKLVLAQLNLRKIVRFEQRRKASGSHTYDEGFWTLTEAGKGVILYLQMNKQVLDNGNPQT